MLKCDPLQLCVWGWGKVIYWLLHAPVVSGQFLTTTTIILARNIPILKPTLILSREVVMLQCRSWVWVVCVVVSTNS